MATTMVKFKTMKSCTYIFLTVMMLVESLTEAFDNTTLHYLQMHEDDLIKGRSSTWSQRKPRFLNVLRNEEDVSIRIEFGYEVFKLPVKKTMDMANGLITAIPTLKLNTATIVAGLGIITGIVFSIPALINVFSITTANTRANHKRGLISHEALMDELNDIIYPNTQLVKICAQRALCAWVKKASKKRDYDDMENFLYTIINHKWLRSTAFFQETSLDDAIGIGVSAERCSYHYSKCEMNHKTIAALSKSLRKFFE